MFVCDNYVYLQFRISQMPVWSGRVLECASKWFNFSTILLEKIVTPMHMPSKVCDGILMRSVSNLHDTIFFCDNIRVDASTLKRSENWVQQIYLQWIHRYTLMFPVEEATIFRKRIMISLKTITSVRGNSFESANVIEFKEFL